MVQSTGQITLHILDWNTLNWYILIADSVAKEKRSVKFEETVS